MPILIGKGELWFMSLSKREKAFVGVFAVVLVFALYYVFFYQPITADIEAMSAEMKTRSDNTKLIQVRQAELDKLKHEFGEMSKMISDALGRLPLQDSAQMIVSLYEIISPRAYRDHIEFGEFEQHQDYAAMPVTLSFSSGYQDFRTILALLEQSNYINHVENMTVQRLDEEGSVRVNMMLKFYFSYESGRQKADYTFMKGDYGKDNPFQSSKKSN